MRNEKYGKLVSDETYLERVLDEAIFKVEDMKKSDGYSQDVAMECIFNWIDELGVRPSDLKYIMKCMNMVFKK